MTMTMMMQARLTGLVVLLAVGWVTAAVPKCDPSITGKLSSLYPDGIPTDILSTLKQNGQYSYVVVSSSETPSIGVKPKCIGIAFKDDNTADVTYKFSWIPALKFNFGVTEDNGVLIQDGTQKYKLYVLYVGDGVIFTYRCCDDCSGSTPNVGIAVVDSLKASEATKKALDAAKARMKELGLDGDVVTLNNCS